jgi:hypothetical protein
MNNLYLGCYDYVDGARSRATFVLFPVLYSFFWLELMIASFWFICLVSMYL